LDLELSPGLTEDVILEPICDGDHQDLYRDAVELEDKILAMEHNVTRLEKDYASLGAHVRDLDIVHKELKSLSSAKEIDNRDLKSLMERLLLILDKQITKSKRYLERIDEEDAQRAEEKRRHMATCEVLWNSR